MKDYTYKKAPCVECGALAWKSSKKQGGATDGRLMCRACHFRVRKAAPRVRQPRELACAWCLTIFTPAAKATRHCSQRCAQRSVAVKRGRSRSVDGGKTRRSDRERVAPGLRASDRARLLKKWKRQGRSCSFCPAPATTIDHAIPLVRGGTNYEGNLVPCCRPCNSSKSDLLTIEWRMGCGNSGTISPSPWLSSSLHRRPAPTRVKATPKPKPKKQKACAECLSTFTVDDRRGKFCSDCCARASRNRHARVRQAAQRQERHGASYVQAVCAGCPTVFSHHVNVEQLFCSRACSRREQKRRARQRVAARSDRGAGVGS